LVRFHDLLTRARKMRRRTLEMSAAVERARMFSSDSSNDDKFGDRWRSHQSKPPPVSPRWKRVGLLRNPLDPSSPSLEKDVIKSYFWSLVWASK
jgi:hypothetical protein